MSISILTTDLQSLLDVVFARQRTRQIAALLGFDSQDQTKVATAVSEIARNAVQHAGGGKVEFQLAGDDVQVFQILITDKGAGIADLQHILDKQSAFTHAPGASIRGAQRLMDLFRIETAPAKGTSVLLGKQRPRHLPAIENNDMARIMKELMKRVSDDPVAEIQRQNQELLHTLEEVRAQQEERMEHLKEIEMLNMRLKRSIQATHHRVKNNLQIISALVEVQIDEDEETVPKTSMARIGQHTRALAAIHDLLTLETKANAETDVISTSAAMDKLMPLLQATAGGRHLHYQVDDFCLPVGGGASLVLLISELISNAVKHGRSSVELTLRVQEDMARLEVCDDGPGFPADFDWQVAANTGLNLIDSTGRHDLQGTLSFENRPEGGARVVVLFPVAATDV